MYLRGDVEGEGDGEGRWMFRVVAAVALFVMQGEFGL